MSKRFKYFFIISLFFIVTLFYNEYVALTTYKDNIDISFFKDFIIKTLISFFLLLLIIYILYKKLLQEKYLKDNILKQKNFLEDIIEKSPNPIFVLDNNKNYFLANDATAKMFNLSSNWTLLNKSHIDTLKDKEYRKSFEKDEDYVLKNNKIVYRGIQKIEDEYYKLTFIPLDNSNYQLKNKMTLIFATNISSEVKRKKQLDNYNSELKMEIFDEMLNRMKTNEKFKKIFDNIDDAMFISIIDKNGKLNEFSDINTAGINFIKNSNYNKDLDPNNIFDGFKFSYDKSTKNMKVSQNSYIKTIKNGNKKSYLKISCHIILVKYNFKAIIFVQNIDKIMKLKKDKKKQRVLITNIFRKASSGIAVVDKDGIFIKFNQSFYETMGYDKAELKEKNFLNIFTEEFNSDIKEEHYELFKIRKKISKEYMILSKNGEYIYILASSTLIKNENGKLLRLFIFENITKQKKLEFEDIENSKILAQQAKMAEMGEMIGAIAHQWRQPLNAINAAAIKLNFSSSLNILDNNEINEKTKFIENQSLKMSETINDFMNFFKPSKDKEYFIASNIYKKIIDFLEPQLKSRGIKASVKGDSDIKIYGFKNEFEHILLNLINNAKDAFENSEKKDKYIVINFDESKEFNTIQVIDNAGGIPDDIIDKIFNPYFTTKEEGKGTGIGLYMTKTIIEKHFNGKIEVLNDKDEAIFIITIPKEL